MVYVRLFSRHTTRIAFTSIQQPLVDQSIYYEKATKIDQTTWEVVVWRGTFIVNVFMHNVSHTIFTYTQIPCPSTTTTLIIYPAHVLWIAGYLQLIGCHFESVK